MGDPSLYTEGVLRMDECKVLSGSAMPRRFPGDRGGWDPSVSLGSAVPQLRDHIGGILTARSPAKRSRAGPSRAERGRAGRPSPPHSHNPGRPRPAPGCASPFPRRRNLTRGRARLAPPRPARRPAPGR